MNIVLLGAPGSGKGYVSSYLKQQFGFNHISTGELIRANIKNKTELGRYAEEIIARGELLPDDVIMKIIKQELQKCQNGNNIFDGFPRTLNQAKLLQDIANVDMAIYIDVPFEMIIKRVASRRVCATCGTMQISQDANGKCEKCGGELVQRDDDKPEVVSRRLKVYRDQTAPLINFYQNKNNLIKVDNSGSADYLFAQIDSIVKDMSRWNNDLQN